ncbi:ribose-5-phosphate isomerase RpiA [Paenibacillus cymbidii]|uniref:ribose-5-phosphate isomerase RpiA n=1 Tax=Paenibacillus cymbidii TaxID=1639034 RepID=UPI00108118E1|nr:ribose-5-phosphate isomerase RpiA [Paenibacillus cymbidii]
MEAKQLAAERAVQLVEDGMTIGLGTGTTATYAIRRIGALVRGGLRIRAIATSLASERLAAAEGIPLVAFAELDGSLDLTIDGADEVDPELRLIKGGGGALLREKIVAAASERMIVIVDAGKLVKRLGAFPLPVEIVPFGNEATMRQLDALGCRPELRWQGGVPFRTDNGNYVADCAFGAIADPERLAAQLNHIPGVVENGLFVGLASRVIVGYDNGTVREWTRQSRI